MQRQLVANERTGGHDASEGSKALKERAQVVLEPATTRVYHPSGEPAKTYTEAHEDSAQPSTPARTTGGHLPHPLPDLRMSLDPGLRTSGSRRAAILGIKIEQHGVEIAGEFVLIL